MILASSLSLWQPNKRTLHLFVLTWLTFPLSLYCTVLYYAPSRLFVQYADLGKYGTFELVISADEGTMTWNSDLSNIDELADELGLPGGIQQLNYHLHSFWALSGVDYAIGGTDCGASNTGGHYDPFFGVSNTLVIVVHDERIRALCHVADH
jgi:hypothetical protein